MPVYFSSPPEYAIHRAMAAVLRALEERHPGVVGHLVWRDAGGEIVPDPRFDYWQPVPQAATTLGMSQAAVRRRCRDGTVEAVKSRGGRWLVCTAGPGEELRWQAWVDRGTATDEVWAQYLAERGRRTDKQPVDPRD